MTSNAQFITKWLLTKFHKIFTAFSFECLESKWLTSVSRSTEEFEVFGGIPYHFQTVSGAKYGPTKWSDLKSTVEVRSRIDVLTLESYGLNLDSKSLCDTEIFAIFNQRIAQVDLTATLSHKVVAEASDIFFLRLMDMLTLIGQRLEQF